MPLVRLSGVDRNCSRMQSKPSANVEKLAAYVNEAADDGDCVDRVVDVEFGANLPEYAKALKPGAVVATYASMKVPAPGRVAT